MSLCTYLLTRRSLPSVVWWRVSGLSSLAKYNIFRRTDAAAGEEHVHKYNVFKKHITLQDNETAQNLKKLFQLSGLQKLGLSIAAVLGFLCFIVYEALTLPTKVKPTNDAYENERQERFIYPKKPMKLQYEDVFETGIKQRLKYNVEKHVSKVQPWLESKVKDPGLSLKLAESRNPIRRQIGLSSLTDKYEWQDYQYRMVAQACNNETMVSLARMPNADPRLFRPMPWLPPPTASIEDEFRSLLADMAKEEIHECIKQLTSRALLEGPPKNIIEAGPWVYEGTAQQYMQSFTDTTAGKMEINFLRVLASHSMVPSQCELFVERSGLLLLHRVYLELYQNVVVRRLIALILANLSLNPKLHKAIVDGGWVAVLHQWQATTDTALYFETARALANLDRDWRVGGQIQGIYEQGVYLAHPIKRLCDGSPRSRYTDVIFVHGLLGGPFKTWRQEDRREREEKFKVTDEVRKSYTFFWPKDWLAREVPELRILNIGYETELTMWSPKCTMETDKRTLSERSKVLIDKLKKAGVGSRPIIWVGHSMGGLLIKEILQQVDDDPQLSKWRAHTAGVLFYSTPHLGSPLANTGQLTRYMTFPSIEVQELREDNPYLKTLNEKFEEIVTRETIPIFSFGESEKTLIPLFKTVIVPEESANPGFGKFQLVPSNHLNICKPRDRDSKLYQETLSFIRNCIHKHKVKDKMKDARHKVDQVLNIKEKSDTL